MCESPLKKGEHMPSKLGLPISSSSHPLPRVLLAHFLPRACLSQKVSRFPMGSITLSQQLPSRLKEGWSAQSMAKYIPTSVWE